MKRILSLALVISLAACAQQRNQTSANAPAPTESRPASGVLIAPVPNARVDGKIGGPANIGAGVSLGEAAALGAQTEGGVSGEIGTIALDFVDTDMRDVVAQILGRVLQVNYTIDPAVKGTVTLRTANPLTREQLIPTLRVLLGQNGATLIQSGSLYRVVPNGAGSGSGAANSGFAVLPLHYANADDLAKTLQPFVTSGGKVVSDPGSNALLIGGDPEGREAMLGLARSFDIDALAGQSYAVFPVGPGAARGFAQALQDALRGDANASQSRDIRVVALRRVDAVLVVGSRPSAIAAARRVVALIERQRRATVRSWRIYYLHNGRTDDVTNFLQRAFTPNEVNTQASSGRSASGVSPGSTAPGDSAQSLAAGGLNAQSGAPSGGAGQSGAISSQQLPPPGGSTNGGQSAQPAQPNEAAMQDEQSANLSGQELDPDRLRIVPNRQNNAVAIYATQNEADLIEGMLRKVDIMPQQVRIDATVAEVTLNDALNYGTQFYFKQGGLNGQLSSVFNSSSTGFFVAGNNSAQVAISALQAVTNVQVLSSPQLMVMDNEAARLQVGNLVPYLTGSSQSTLTANAQVINTINYRQTGVILDVVPHIGADGMVTLDIGQEVSDIDNTISTANTGINSPTFSDRTVRTRIVVQDGQTIGIAGLIRDNASTGNQGIPFLKDIPLLGTVLGQQNNTRQRTELLVLVTPHLVHDQREARSLTQDLQEQLPNAARVSDQLRTLAPTGSADPQATLRRKVGLTQ